MEFLIQKSIFYEQDELRVQVDISPETVLGYIVGYLDAMRVEKKMENMIHFISRRNIPYDPDEELLSHEHQEWENIVMLFAPVVPYLHESHRIPLTVSDNSPNLYSEDFSDQQGMRNP